MSKKEKEEVNLKGKVELQKLVAYWEDLVSCLKAGTVCIQNGEHAVALSPEGLVDVEIKASKKSDKESLLIEVSWRKEGEVDKALDLRITSNVPSTASAEES